jgi:hypothetical protein
MDALPLFVRSHNVEHRYMAQQARAAYSLRSTAAWNVARIGLKRFEARVLKSANWVFDVSYDDMKYWKANGVAHISWAPPAFSLASGHASPPEDLEFDLGFIGNLNRPNNLKGIKWFLDSVLPLVRSALPNIKICIAGSNPSAEALQMLSGVPNVQLTLNPVTSSEILSRCRTLFNPILTGSGINVKTIEMLLWRSPVVTTPVGARGFPPEIKKHLCIARDEHGFARAIVDAMAMPLRAEADQAALEAAFGEAAIDQMHEKILALMSSAPRVR